MHMCRILDSLWLNTFQEYYYFCLGLGLFVYYQDICFVSYSICSRLMISMLVPKKAEVGGTWVSPQLQSNSVFSLTLTWKHRCYISLYTNDLIKLATLVCFCCYQLVKACTGCFLLHSVCRRRDTHTQTCIFVWVDSHWHLGTLRALKLNFNHHIRVPNP